MGLHLKKLCVGATDIDHLRACHVILCDQLKKADRTELNPKGLIMPYHDTRNMPRRKDEMANGSLYWVRKKKYFARQKIYLLEERYNESGKRFCRIWLENDLIAVAPNRERNFQGWRYLKPQDSPPDLNQGHDDIENELRQMGLLG